jgi:hypothetical protein
MYATDDQWENDNREAFIVEHVDLHADASPGVSWSSLFMTRAQRIAMVAGKSNTGETDVVRSCL